MKKNKLISAIMIFLIVSFSVFIFENANAANAGSATIGYTGPTTGSVGSEITVKLVVSNIVVDSLNIGICGLGGNISFNSEYLEYVSAIGMTSPYLVQIVPSNSYKIAGVDMTLASGFNTNTDIITLKFKVKKAGSTSLTFNNGQLNDCKNNRLTQTVAPKVITLTEAVVKDSNNFLSSLSVSGQTISPTFNKNTNDYTLTVPNSTSSVTLNAALESTKATLSGTGSKSLNVGSNRFEIIATAENGSKRTYSITIKRESASLSNDNTLNNLTVSGYSLSPNFNSSTSYYTLTIPNEATQIIVNASKNNDKANVVITGNTNLSVGNNEVVITVTAEDGSKKIYKINVARESTTTEKPVLDKDATLKSINIGGFTLKPTFNKNTNVYNISVGEKVDGLKVDAIASSEKAKVNISGNQGWKYGINQVSITVTAEDGSKNVYIINVNRKDPNATEESKGSSDNYLTNINIEGVSIMPTFDRNVSNYSVKVPYEVSNLKVNYSLSSSKAKVEITGNNDLKVNEVTTIQIKVTAEDGSIRIYTVNVTRTAYTSNNHLKNLQVRDFSLNPSFDKNTFIYNVKVKHNTERLDITSLAENSKAKIEILNNDNFKVGSNTVLIKVTDENGFTQIYQINVEKPELSIFGMSIGTFTMFTLLGLGLITIFIILVSKKNKNDKPSAVPIQPQTPIIDFKPEFNFGSRNKTDDDTIYPHSVLNQGSKFENHSSKNPEISNNFVKEIPYDPYDEIVTKDELIDAIQEGLDSKNPEKLKMLLEQEALNRKKEELKLKEESSKKDAEDNWNF